MLRSYAFDDGGHAKMMMALEHARARLLASTAAQRAQETGDPIDIAEAARTAAHLQLMDKQVADDRIHTRAYRGDSPPATMFEDVPDV